MSFNLAQSLHGLPWDLTRTLEVKNNSNNLNYGMKSLQLRKCSSNSSLHLYYVGVLISFWLFLIRIFLIYSTTKIIFLGWVKEVRTTKP
jgi:hypothetical protein